MNTVNIDMDVLGQCFGVTHTIIASAAVGHDPGDLFGLFGGVITQRRACVLATIVEVDPLLVRSHQFAIASVGGRPVDVGLGVDISGTLQSVPDPDLIGPMATGARRRGVIAQEHGVGPLPLLRVVRQHATVDGALLSPEQGTSVFRLPRSQSLRKMDRLDGRSSPLQHQLVLDAVALIRFWPD